MYCSLFASDNQFWNDLSTQQREQLQKGEAVVVEEDVPESAWPRFIIYDLVNASPEEVASVFWNSELDSQYVPNCLSVRIIDRPCPWVYDGEFTLKMPFFLPNEVYVSRNELHPPSVGDYEISWKVLSSHYIKACEGDLQIETQGSGEGGKKQEVSLIRYSNLVKPGSKFAALLRSRAGVQVVESVKALVTRVNHEASCDPQLLSRQVQALKNSLPPHR